MCYNLFIHPYIWVFSSQQMQQGLLLDLSCLTVVHSNPTPKLNLIPYLAPLLCQSHVLPSLKQADPVREYMPVDMQKTSITGASIINAFIKSIMAIPLRTTRAYLLNRGKRKRIKEGSIHKERIGFGRCYHVLSTQACLVSVESFMINEHQ